MASPVSLPKTLLIYAITIPAALVLGYMLTTPLDTMSFMGMLLALFILCSPVLIRSHYPILVFSWHAWISIFFLPGRPLLWMLMVLLSLFFSLVGNILSRQGRFLHVPWVTRSLVFFALIILLTAKIRGGVGIRAFGSGSYGGKGYVNMLFAIAGYFALTATTIPLKRVPLYVGIFFLSGMTPALPHLVLYAGPELYWLFYLLPPDPAMTQAVVEFTGTGLARFTGVSLACLAAYSFMLARYGIRGNLTTQHPVRFLVFLLMVAGSMMGGYRSMLAWVVVSFAVQFLCEGLYKTKFLPMMVGAVVFAAGLLVPFARDLPLQVQRTISFLPVDVEASVRWDTTATTEWRLNMWKAMLPDLHKYVFLGKGFTLNPTDLWLTEQAMRRGLADSYESAIEAGDYHNGPLSVYVPFGLPGVVAFTLFLVFGVRLLYRNFRHGDPALKQVNTFLLAFFITRIVIFVFVFGSIKQEFWEFTGLVGLSVALNGGEKEVPKEVPAPALAPAYG
ncbi:MAG: O-antigen ligase family protein [Verrucomicrobia bacterium]|nr:O-antigen ligase family protein [Verrucomicrobiota bacterium]